MPTRLLPLAVFIGGVLLFAAPSFAQQYFSDIPEGNRAGQCISDAAYHQLMEGFPDGKFRPDASLARAEAVVVLARLLNVALKGFMVMPGTGMGALRLPDVPSRHWMMPAAEFLVARGLFFGALDQPFRPDAPITRGEFTRALCRVIHPEVAGEPSAALRLLQNDTILPDDWSSKPLETPISRGEVADLLEQTLTHLTQNAVTAGKIAHLEIDPKGLRWVTLETPIGEGRLCLPTGGVVIRGGSSTDLHEGIYVRTVSDAVPGMDGPVYYRVREVTILSKVASR